MDQYLQCGGIRVATRPVSYSPTMADVIRAVAGASAPIVLDSARSDVADGRYTIVACNPLEVFEADGTTGDPFERMRAHLARTGLLEHTRTDGQAPLPVFAGGWVGYFAYEAGRFIERLPATTNRDIGLPLARFGLYDSAAILDHRTGRWTVVAADFGHADVTDGRPRVSLPERLDWWQALLRSASENHRLRPASAAPPKPCGPVVENIDRDRFMRMVEQAREYIAAGDIFQVNLARRETLPVQEPAVELYLRLRQANPGAYAAFLAWDEGGEGRGLAGRDSRDQACGPSPRRSGFGCAGGKGFPHEHRGFPHEHGGCPHEHSCAILSSSPELFLQVEGREVVTRPIKGTRPRSDDPVVDASLRLELATSAKDRAELAMIVDLERNDLGRVCEYGSVRVTEEGPPAAPYAIESHATVHHLVSTVTGRLAPSHDVIDLLRATFPGGSITGAPKVRAMEIIDELEPSERSVYTGSIGYFATGGRMTMNIAIRTMIQASGKLHWYAGGGMIADSVPALEYEETCAKATGMRRAVGIKDPCGTLNTEC
jgi:para-aminobenzoate synthetase component 1